MITNGVVSVAKPDINTGNPSMARYRPITDMLQDIVIPVRKMGRGMY